MNEMHLPLSVRSSLSGVTVVIMTTRGKRPQVGSILKTEQSFPIRGGSEQREGRPFQEEKGRNKWEGITGTSENQQQRGDLRAECVGGAG